MNIVLYEPEIPQNTGNIIRLSANTGCKLSLVEPLGFALNDKRMRRAGLDYHEFAHMQVYASFDEFCIAKPGKRIIAMTTKANQWHTDFEFLSDDVLLFGPETRGLPNAVLAQSDCCLRIPMLATSRSLNLSNSVSIVLYEALRQHGFQSFS